MRRATITASVLACGWLAVGCWIFESVAALPVNDGDAGTAGAVDATAGAADASAGTLLRRRVTIQAGADDVPLGYSIRVPLDDLQALVAAGRVQADVSDVHVRTSSAPPDDERDRVVDVSPEGESPAVWFALAAAIPAHGSDTRYAIEYGDRSLGAPRANGAAVFAFYDDFSGALLSSNRWTTKGNVAIDGGVVLLHGAGGALSELDSTAKMPIASSLDVVASMSRPSSPKYILGYTDGFRWSQFLGEDPSGAVRAYESPCDGGECLGPLVPLTNSASHAYRIDRAPNETRYAFAGQRTTTFGIASGRAALGLSFSNASPQNDFAIQRVRVRLLVADEPTVVLGPEEAVR